MVNVNLHEVTGNLLLYIEGTITYTKVPKVYRILHREANRYRQAIVQG